MKYSFAFPEWQETVFYWKFCQIFSAFNKNKYLKTFFAKDLSKRIYWRYKDKIFTSVSESLRISKFCTRYEFKFRTNIGMLMMLFNVADNYTEEFNKLFLFFL